MDIDSGQGMPSSSLAASVNTRPFESKSPKKKPEGSSSTSSLLLRLLQEDSLGELAGSLELPETRSAFTPEPPEKKLKEKSDVNSAAHCALVTSQAKSVINPRRRDAHEEDLQILNGEEALLLDERLKEIIIDLKVGEQVPLSHASGEGSQSGSGSTSDAVQVAKGYQLLHEGELGFGLDETQWLWNQVTSDGQHWTVERKSSPSRMLVTSSGSLPDLPCLAIKAELPDSCSMEAMMEYADSQDSTCSSLNNSSSSNSPSGASRVMPSLLPLQLQQSPVVVPPQPVTLSQHLGALASQNQTSSGALTTVTSPGSPDRNLCSSTTQVSSDGSSQADLLKDDDDDGPKRSCLVCGDVASGFHYGVSSCEACKAFFKRTIQGSIDYTCPASNDCEINKRRRKACQACRFQKCLRMGMLKEGVRLDRVRGGRQKYRRMVTSLNGGQGGSTAADYYGGNPYGHVQQSSSPATPPTPSPGSQVSGTYNRRLALENNKLLSTLSRCEPEVLKSTSSPNGTGTPEDKYKALLRLTEIYDRELVATITWAKQMPGFSDLPLNDQMRLLQAGWSEVLTLTLIFRSLPRNGILKFGSDFSMNKACAELCGLTEFYQHCMLTSERLERTSLRKEEYLLLKGLVLVNSDVRVDSMAAMSRLKESLLAALWDAASALRSGNPNVHVQSLLLLLPCLRQADAQLRHFWGTVVADNVVPVNKLLVEMLENPVKP